MDKGETIGDGLVGLGWLIRFLVTSISSGTDRKGIVKAEEKVVPMG